MIEYSQLKEIVLNSLILIHLKETYFFITNVKDQKMHIYINFY